MLSPACKGRPILLTRAAAKAPGKERNEALVQIVCARRLLTCFSWPMSRIVLFATQHLEASGDIRAHEVRARIDFALLAPPETSVIVMPISVYIVFPSNLHNRIDINLMEFCNGSAIILILK
jgi:hypothetical protein